MLVAALLQWDGIDINAQEKDGNTALHLAAMKGKTQHRTIVEMLMLVRPQGARTGIPNNQGKTAATVGATTYIQEIIRNPKYIQTRTQMELVSFSPHMTSRTKDQRARSQTVGNALGTYVRE